MSKDLSVFTFTSSQDSSDPSSSQRSKDINRKKKPQNSTRKPTGSGKKPVIHKQTKQVFKRLETVNQQRGFGSEVETPGDGERSSAGEGGQRSRKRVSFHSPAIFSKEPQQENSQGTASIDQDPPQHKPQTSGQKPYHCDLCGQNFSRLRGLKRHQNVHTSSGQRVLSDISTTGTSLRQPSPTLTTSPREGSGGN